MKKKKKHGHYCPKCLNRWDCVRGEDCRQPDGVYCDKCTGRTQH